MKKSQKYFGISLKTNGFIMNWYHFTKAILTGYAMTKNFLYKFFGHLWDVLASLHSFCKEF